MKHCVRCNRKILNDSDLCFKCNKEWQKYMKTHPLSWYKFSNEIMIAMPKDEGWKMMKDQSDERWKDFISERVQFT